MSKLVSSKPAVIVISSHVARGSVGNRAAVFALEILGYPVWAIPTIILPWHPGHGPATRVKPDDQDFGQFLDDIANAPWIGEVSAVLTGYMSSQKQVLQTARLIRTLKKRNPDLIHLCDPVIGDIEGLYLSQEVATAIRDEFIPICDISTPNRFELGWLTGEHTPTSLTETAGLAEKLGADTVLVTSAVPEKEGHTGNFHYDKQAQFMISHPVMEDPPNGPGDLTAAVYLGHLLSGTNIKENVRKTTASVYEILLHSAQRGSDELTLESDAQSIVSPKIEVLVEDL